ncbi:DoxX family protein [Cryptosporangium phraense]|uniref:DoxX family protein n=1 Tax=Cryptosporangium phraense TaxID=2593070 RepID=A0A545AJB3_9ACTN|nr:DoxX family membrane protein [Cryptosporangium phraense]TQS41417.1 DoxX family protein [Cryptosporangium phraense]
MTPVRFAARALLGYTFVRGGYAALRNPGESADAVRPLVERVSTRFPQVPKDPATVVRATAAAQILSGVALATGRAPRLSALLLAGTLVPGGGLLPHRGEDATPETKARQRAELEKNLAVLGGLVLAAVDTEGKPGLSWRARRAARDARKATEHAAKTARRSARSARKSTELAAKSAREKLPV